MNGSMVLMLIEKLGFPIFMTVVLLYWFVAGFVPHNELARINNATLIEIANKEERIINILIATCVNTSPSRSEHDLCLGLRKVDP